MSETNKTNKTMRLKFWKKDKKDKVGPSQAPTIKVIYRKEFFKGDDRVTFAALYDGMMKNAETKLATLLCWQFIHDKLDIPAVASVSINWSDRKNPAVDIITYEELEPDTEEQ